MLRAKLQILCSLEPSRPSTGCSLPNCTLHRKPFRLYPRASCLPDDENMHPFRHFCRRNRHGTGACASRPAPPHRPCGNLPRPREDAGSREPAGHAAEHQGQHLQPPVEHQARPAPVRVHEQVEEEAASGIRGHCPSDEGGACQPKHGEARYDQVPGAFRQHGLLRGRPPHSTRRRRRPHGLWPEPYNTHVGGAIMGARQKDVVEAFIHDEICYDIPGSKKNSYIPATTSITLRRGQEILASDWYACYESIKRGEPCK